MACQQASSLQPLLSTLLPVHQAFQQAVGLPSLSAVLSVKRSSSKGVDAATGSAAARAAVGSITGTDKLSCNQTGLRGQLFAPPGADAPSVSSIPLVAVLQRPQQHLNQHTWLQPPPCHHHNHWDLRREVHRHQGVASTLSSGSQHKHSNQCLQQQQCAARQPSLPGFSRSWHGIHRHPSCIHACQHWPYHGSIRGAAFEAQPPSTLDDLVRRHSKGLQRGFMVIELYPNGATVDSQMPLSAADLGIAFRDTQLFSSENSFTDQKPTILARQNSILFKSEAVRAIIHQHKAYIFKTKPNKSYSNLLQPLTQTLKPDVKLRNEERIFEPHTGQELPVLHDGHKELAHHGLERDIPFELNVLEGLLFISTSWFDTRMRTLKKICDGMMKDIYSSSEPFAAVYNEALIQQVAPLDKAITSLHNGASATVQAVREVLEDEEILHNICLTYKSQQARMEKELEHQLGDSGCGHLMHTETRHSHSKHPEYDYMSYVEQARRMLESYDRELDAIAGQLFISKDGLGQVKKHAMKGKGVGSTISKWGIQDEMRENLDTIRDSWSMKLDSARNHIILLNLKMTLASLCLMAATMLPSWGGMNIEHGLPDEPWVFWSVAATSVVLGIFLYPMCTSVYRHNWRHRTRRDMLRFHTLRQFLLEHFEHLDDVICALKKIDTKMSRPAFELHMKHEMPQVHWKNASLDFLFNQFDSNKDGFLDGIEITMQTAKEQEVEQHHLPPHLTKGSTLDEEYDQAREEPATWGEWVRYQLGMKKGDSMLRRVLYGQEEPLLVEQRSGGRIVRH